MNSDKYKTLKKASPEAIIKDRGSKFLAYGFPVETESEVKDILEELWQQHPKASHICYAWQLGKRYEHYRANDDGEPNNSAGMPIYGQLQAANLTNCLVTVVRYYGGVNLGVGGLISAYKASAKMTLETGTHVMRTIKSKLLLNFDYPRMNDVMRIIKEENLNILDQELYLDCKITLAVRENKVETIKNRFEVIKGITCKLLTD